MAQKIRFNDTTNVWYTCSEDYIVQQINAPTRVDVISKDTVVNGYQYFHHTRYNAWMREDTLVAGRFYYTNYPGGAETLFMDYNLNIGDSMYFLNSPKAIKLVAIDSVQVNGTYHKLQVFDGQKILEGIGPDFATVDGWYYQFFPICCFENNSARASFSPAPWADFGCALSVKQANQVSLSVTIAPHPVTNDSRILLPYMITGGNITVVNSTGQTIHTKQLRNEKQLALPANLLPGIYYYRISDNEKDKAFTGNFVVEH